MTRGLERILVGGDFGVERVFLGGDLAIDLRRVEPRPFERGGEVVALVPVLLPAPDQLTCLMREDETLAAPRSCLTHPRDAADIGLLGGDLARRGILHDRIGARRPEGNAVKLRHAHHVAQRIGQPVGMVAFEEIGFADRQRPDRAQRDGEIVVLRHGTVPADRKVAVGRTEAEIELCGQGHAGTYTSPSSQRKLGPLSALRQVESDPALRGEDGQRKKQLIPACSAVTVSPSSAKPVIVP